MNFHFKRRKSNTQKLAAAALSDMRALVEINYPVAMLLERHFKDSIDRRLGESWPMAIARSMGLQEVGQLASVAKGVLDAGRPQEEMPESQQILYFKGWAALLVECERETAAMA